MGMGADTGDTAVWERVRAVAARQDGVLTRAQANELGVSDTMFRRMVRQGRWAPLARSAYWVVADGRPRLRTRVRGALLSSGAGAVACGVTAARLHGLHGVHQTAARTVHVACPRPGASRPGLRMHRLSSRQTTLLRGLPVTTVAQSVADVLRAEDRATAVSVLDSALHQGLLASGAAELEQALRGYPGCERARGLLPQADGRAESPLETRGRLVCADAGMPPEVLQWRLTDPSTGVCYRIDLGWPSRGVGVEADGQSVHSEPEALYADRIRQNALLAAHRGLVLLRFTWRDAMEPGRFLATLRQAMDTGA
ncbi:hypothetical protein N566_11605 [Streptomycetaceae bacterium MP113-05]|nr:hypothetical protein N566_11605 [Streptomycetaceae bacterium MP113-05]